MVISAVLLIPLVLILVTGSLITEGSMPPDDEIAALSERLIVDSMKVLRLHPPGTLLENSEAWPESIRTLEPLSLWVGREGLYIHTRQRFVESWGIFIPREGSEKLLEKDTLPSYTRVTQGVYKFYAE